MPKFYATFGQRYATEPHPHGGHPNGWFEINAPSHESARMALVKIIGTKWATTYEEGDFNPKSFPLGCLMTVDAMPIVGGDTTFKDAEAQAILGSHKTP